MSTSKPSSRRGSTMTPTLPRVRHNSGVSQSQEALKAIEKTAMLTNSPDLLAAAAASATSSSSSVAPKRFAFEDEIANAKLICSFPKDDLSVITFPKRDYGGLGPDVDSEEFKKLDPSGMECVSFLKAPWRAVVRNYGSFKAAEDAAEEGKKEEQED